MSTMNCPYCKSDQGAQFENIPVTITSRYRVCLCANCGEPLMIESDGFRKPTADELVMLVEKSPLNEVRGAWLENQRRAFSGEGPPLQHLWRQFEKSPFIKGAPSEEMKNFMRQMFYSVAGLTYFYLKRLLEEKSADEVQAIAMLIEAELEVFKEAMEQMYNERRQH